LGEMWKRNQSNETRAMKPPPTHWWATKQTKQT
jgi:hypothetical protein